MTENALWRSEIEKLLNDFPCRTAVLAARLPVDGSRAFPLEKDILYRTGEQEKVVSASTIKLPILLAALSLCDQGQLHLAQQLTLDEANILDDTEVFEPENRQTSYSLWELLYWMIVESDNTATNRLLDLLGYDVVNQFCRSLALTETEVQRKMLDWDAIAAGKNNYTSLQDQYRLYAALFGGRLLKPETQTVALDILTRQRSMSGILRYIPQNVPFAHKTGCLDYLEHDAGVFLGDEKVFIGIFTWDGPSPEGDKRQLCHIGRLGKLLFKVAYPDL